MKIPYDDLNITVPADLKKDLDKRKEKGFNASGFFVEKYTEEFMNVPAMKAEIEVCSKRIKFLNKRLIGEKETSPVKPNDDPLRCPVCSMFFNEKMSFRKKVQVSKTLAVCSGCKEQRPDEVKAMGVASE